jgi:hypothetical protein
LPPEELNLQQQVAMGESLPQVNEQFLHLEWWRKVLVRPTAARTSAAEATEGSAARIMTSASG